ncbi:hypothetical protein GCM10028822_39730 [Hymenobacter terrigena]
MAAPVLAPVELTFTQPITTASAPGLRVYGSQRRGRRTGTLSGGGTSTLRFAPTQPFAPGERVSVNAPATLTNAAGVGLRPQVYQFTAATGGPGRGVFLDTTEVAYTNNRDLLLGDIDNDGDLDLLTTAGLYGVYSFINNGIGGFARGANVVVANTPSGAALADFNQDGFLDLIAGDADNPSVSIALNDGTGVFGTSGFAGQNLTVGGLVSGVATGDIDADGDLDFVSANSSTATVTMGFNNSSGFFGGLVSVGVGSQPSSVQLADVDNDGDLDILTSNRGNNSVTVRLNNGLGVFSTSPALAVGVAPVDLALADFDANGSVDVLAANGSNVSVTLNNNGIFGNVTILALPTGSTPTALSTGDVDADGDLDFVVAQGTGGQVITFLNNGSGGFAAQPGPLVLAGGTAVGAALGDVDGDGDLDLLTARGGRVVLGRNGVAPTLSSFSSAAGAPGTTLTLGGTGLVGTRRITFAGAAGNVVSSGFTVNTAGTQITGVVVPNGAITGPISATTGSGTGATSASFVVNAAQLSVLQNGTLYLPAGPAFSFTNQYVTSTSAPVTFTLSNPGSLPLLLSGATTTGDFAVVGAVPTTVPAGGSTTLTVVFQPSALGARTGTLVLSSNASGFPSYVLALGGTGVAPPPTVAGFSPASAWPGASISITGTSLTGATAITFSGTANNVVSTGFSATSGGSQLTGVLVPAGAVTGPVTVTTPGGTSAGVQFTVVPPPPPTLTSVSPGSAPAGATVTLTGTNLLGATQVQFSFYSTNFTVINSTTLTAVVPFGAAPSGPIVVTTPAGTSNALTFQVLPYLIEVTPVAGVPGASIRLTGNDLSVTAVRVNGTNATFTSFGSYINFTVPGAATSGLVGGRHQQRAAVYGDAGAFAQQHCAHQCGRWGHHRT